MKTQHEEALAEMAMQMDTECAKMKAECDKKILEATTNSQAEEYKDTNNEADEERIGLLLNNGTHVI